MSVMSCRCCMFVSCVHPVAVLNAAFCMTCSLLMLVEDGRGILQRYGCRLLSRPKIDIQSSIVKTSTYFLHYNMLLCRTAYITIAAIFGFLFVHHVVRKGMYQHYLFHVHLQPLPNNRKSIIWRCSIIHT